MMNKLGFFAVAISALMLATLVPLAYALEACPISISYQNTQFPRDAWINIVSTKSVGPGWYNGIECLEARLTRLVYAEVWVNGQRSYVTNSGWLWIKTLDWYPYGWVNWAWPAQFSDNLNLSNLGYQLFLAPNHWEHVKYTVYYRVEWWYNHILTGWEEIGVSAAVYTYHSELP